MQLFYNLHRPASLSEQQMEGIYLLPGHTGCKPLAVPSFVDEHLPFQLPKSGSLLKVIYMIDAFDKVWFILINCMDN
jgi:hypothetical protein